MPSNTSNTQGLLIPTRRIFSAMGDIKDVPELDAIDTVRRFPAQWAFTPFPGKPTDMYRPAPGQLLVRE